MTKEQDTELEKLAEEHAEQIYGRELWRGLDSNVDNRMDGFIAGYKASQDRITWLETANAFHQKEAHEAQQEQYRLIKENATLLEVIQEQERAKDILINRIEGLRKDNVT